jgi:aspartate/methionine/tyrosine aminotransferase
MSLRPFALERWFALHELSAPHLLSASDCETLSVGELLTLAGAPVEALTDLRLGYTDSQGEPELRARIAALYPGLGADDIVVTNAPQEAILLALRALLAPGHRAVVQVPCYQSLSELAADRGAEVVPWPLVETDTGWRADLDALDRLLDGARLLVVNAPHNPTGWLPDRTEWDRIVASCAAHGTWLFSDEMYRGLERAPEDRLRPAASCTARAVSLWGMSKAFGLAGLRIGWLAVTDRPLRDRIVGLKDYTTICASGPGQRLAGLALAAADAILARNRALIDDNLELARRVGWLEWREPTAGSVAFARLRGGGAAAFCARAVRAAGVMLVPSTLFDAGDAHVRIGLGRRGFAAALAALEAPGHA